MQFMLRHIRLHVFKGRLVADLRLLQCGTGVQLYSGLRYTAAEKA
jgi:hypothetical protein